MSSKTIVILLRRSSTDMSVLSLASLRFSSLWNYSCDCSYSNCLSLTWNSCAMPSRACRLALSLLIFSSSLLLSSSFFLRYSSIRASSFASSCLICSRSSSSSLRNLSIFSCRMRSSSSFCSRACSFLILHCSSRFFCAWIFWRRSSALLRRSSSYLFAFSSASLLSRCFFSYSAILFCSFMAASSRIFLCLSYSCFFSLSLSYSCFRLICLCSYYFFLSSSSCFRFYS